MNETVRAQAQAKAREYFRTRGTLADVPGIRAQIHAAFSAFEAAIEPLAAGPAARRALEGEWSVHEVVDHLVESHRAGLDELWCLLAGQRPPGDPIPAGLQSRTPWARPWPWLTRELRALHRDLLAALDGVAPDFTTEARVALVMVVNVEDAGRRVPFAWVEDVDWKAYAIVFRLHALDHLNQVRKVLAALAAA
jgi:hypothetical protein